MSRHFEENEETKKSHLDNLEQVEIRFEIKIDY